MSLSSPLFCDNCGAANRTQALFCRVCGQSLRQDNEIFTVTSTMSKTITGLLAPLVLLKQRYKILGQAGRGGFGAVYKAADTQFGNRLVAVKEMSQNSLRPQEYAEALEAFNREASLLASLTHPNLPRIYEQFTENGRSYLVMDFIDGETLEVRLERLGTAKLPVEKVLDIALQLCSVLDYLHTRQPPIIFRDLKPANVMLTSNGHVYLIDFGIARHFKPGQEKDTTALGSYGYAPPEQYGKSQTTTRADIYSLGATLHQLLSGEDPSETPFQFSRLHISDPLLTGLDALVMSMVNVDVAKRPASIGAVRQLLQHIINQYTLGGTLPRMTVGSLHITKPATTLPPTLPPAKVNPYQQQAAVASVEPAKKRSRTTAQPQIYPQPNMLYVCLGHASRITSVAWSPDGKYLASASYDKTVLVWNASNGQNVRIYKGHTARVNAVAWSPDSKLLATASDDRTVHLWDPLSGKADYIFKQHSGSVNALTWSPDGRHIASGGSDKTVLVWNISTHDVWLTYQEHTDHVLSLAWSPDGHAIASAGKDRVVKIWDPGKLQQKRSFWRDLFFSAQGQKTWSGHGGQIYSVAWSPDSRYLATGCSDHHVRVREMSGMHFTHTLGVDNATMKNAVAWSPSGKHLAIGGNDKAVRLWNYSENRQTFTYSGHSSYVISVSWSPDGSKIASAGVDRTVQVWQAV